MTWMPTKRLANKNKNKNKTLLNHAVKCQQKLHEWVRANQVELEPMKETVSIISRHDPHGPEFELAGVVFDTTLTMNVVVAKLQNFRMWILKSILKLIR